MEPQPDYEQPEGSADPSAKLSDPDKDESSLNEDKNSGQQANDESQINSSSVTTGTPTKKETTERSNDGMPVERDPVKDDSLHNGGKNSGQQANDESQINSSRVSTGTLTKKETTESPDVDPVKDDSLHNGDKNSGQQANDESQIYSSSVTTGVEQNEKKPDDCVPDGNQKASAATPTGETTEPCNDDIIPDKGDPDKDESSQNGGKNSGQQANDESQMNSSSVTTGTPTKKETTESPSGDILVERDPVKDDSSQNGGKNSGQQANEESQINSSSVTTVKSEEVDHPPEKDKIISYQADDKQQGYSKGDPSENEKPDDTTPDECSNQNLLRTSAVSKKEPPSEKPEEQKKKMSKSEDVELIGPTATQTELAEEAGILGGGIKLLMAVVVVVLVAIVAQYFLQAKSPPQTTDGQQVDVFLKQMKKVKARFPNQRAELWSRSEIHLKRHLQTSQPAEPVSLILTSGVRAERTMRCLAKGVASAFSDARNASVLHIDGAGQAGQDSDQVKLDIDRKLQGAFEGDKPVAVIHRLEELPPGSTLIFYRYCDHENAAYKKTFLIFTVLLGDEEEVPVEMRLNVVEEMVDDYLQKRFLSHDHPVSFDRMDLNKYGGLWSRISHLILPVAAEDRIEHEGC